MSVTTESSGAAGIRPFNVEFPDKPNTRFPGTLTPDQQTLAATMRSAWTSFAATGNPSTAALHWPSIGFNGSVMSLVSPRPMVETDSSAIHHCAFWDAAQNP